ncbi:phospholipase A2 family protein [Klebsiella pneumoniae]|nr:phospholipase A2 family protein [Klebsiella pneumoniae]
MNVLLLLTAAIMAFGPMQAEGSLSDLRKMIWLTTGKNAATSYAFYGCHCGWGGRGAPKDATDWCCATHDCCYDRLEKRGCRTKSLSYEFTHQGSRITCAANQDSCKWRLCQCDKAVAECFARNLESYDEKYEIYFDMLCKGKSPQCRVSSDTSLLA